MLIRAVFAAVAIGAIVFVHSQYPWVRSSTLLLLLLISIGSIGSSHLAKVAAGILAILLSFGLAQAIPTLLESIGLRTIVLARFDVISLLVLVCFVGVLSALLHRYANCNVWHLLGSLGMFLLLLVTEFYGKSPMVLGAGLLLGILVAVPWLIGMTVTALLRR